MAIVAPERIVPVKIRASDETKAAVESAKVGIKGIGDQSQSTTTAMKAHWNGMRMSFMQTALVVGGAMLAMRKAWDLADTTAQFLEQQAALDGLGRKYAMTGAQIVAATQKASTGLLSMKEAADVAAKSLAKGFSPRQLTDMTQVAEKMSNVFQFDLAEGVSSLGSAIQTGMLRPLKQNFGLVVDLEAAYKKFAIAQNVNVAALDEQTKRQIRHNAIMDAAKAKLVLQGEATDSIDDKMTRFKKTADDFALFIGQIAIRFLAFLQTIWGGLAGWVEKSASLALAPFGWLERQLEKFGINVTDRFFTEWSFKMDANSGIMFDKMKEGWSIMTSSVEALAGKSGAAIQDMGDDIALGQEAITAKFYAELQKRFEAMNAAFEKQKELGRKRVESDQRVQDILLELHGTEFDQRRQEINAEFEMLRQHASDKIALEVAYHEALRQLREEEKKKEKEDAEERKQKHDEEWAARRQIVANAMGSFAEMFAVLANIQGKHQKAAFLAFKAFAIAEAVINAHAAFTMALRSLPPPFSYIAAAAAFAAGIARVAAIASMQPSGGATSGGGASAPAPAAAAPMMQTPERGEIRGGQTINIHIAGNLVNMDELGRELVPSIQRALADGVA